MIEIYNTLTKTKEAFRPIEEGRVRIYVCGPTVYNLIHIGNARPMIFFDTLRRYFLYQGWDVNYVSNFTDVDDKIIKAAVEEGVEAGVISERYIEECKRDMASLNVLPATTHPKATEEIDGMLDMIDVLMRKEFAYKGEDGTVYYRTRKFHGYGKLSHKNLDDLRSGERELKVSGEAQKEDPLDFVLWKPKKEGEPFWHSPWCDGRPGWHIECSVMSRRYLGEEIDIHGGGEDLIFPHHENEIAQSEAASGRDFAHYWMHNAFLNIDNRKMSKSLGNFFTVRDVLEKYDPQVLRFFMLSAHYRSPLNFSAELMESAKNAYERIVNCADNLKFLLRGKAVDTPEALATYQALEAAVKQAQSDGTLTEDEETLLKETESYLAQFNKAMDDDFNTADAIAAVFELVRFINSHAKEEATAPFLQILLQEVMTLSDVLGLIVLREETLGSDDEAAEIEALIAERQAARKEKNFSRADEIRDELAARGIVLEDTREGVKWHRA